MTKFALTRNQTLAAPKKPVSSEVKVHLECKGSELLPAGDSKYRCNKCLKVGYPVRKITKAAAAKKKAPKKKKPLKAEALVVDPFEDIAVPHPIPALAVAAPKFTVAMEQIQFEVKSSNFQKALLEEQLKKASVMHKYQW